MTSIAVKWQTLFAYKSNSLDISLAEIIIAYIFDKNKRSRKRCSCDNGVWTCKKKKKKLRIKGETKISQRTRIYLESSACVHDSSPRRGAWMYVQSPKLKRFPSLPKGRRTRSVSSRTRRDDNNHITRPGGMFWKKAFWPPPPSMPRKGP